MSILVRFDKSEKQWSLLESLQEMAPEYPCSVLGELIEKEDGQPSFWKVNGLNDSELGLIIGLHALGGLSADFDPKIGPINIHYIDEQEAIKIGVRIDKRAGNLAAPEIDNRLHFEIVDLSAQIAFKLLVNMTQNSHLYSEGEVAEMVGKVYKKFGPFEEKKLKKILYPLYRFRVLKVDA